MNVQKSLQILYRSLDVLTVALLLSGQINLSGVFFFKGGGFSLSFAGPITGGRRAVSAATPAADTVIDFISVVASYLLILDQINVTGTLVTQGGFTIVLSGPVFGEWKRVAYAPEAREFFAAYKDHVMQSLSQ